MQNFLAEERVEFLYRREKGHQDALDIYDEVSETIMRRRVEGDQHSREYSVRFDIPIFDKHSNIKDYLNW